MKADAVLPDVLLGLEPFVLVALEPDGIRALNAVFVGIGHTSGRFMWMLQ